MTAYILALWLSALGPVTVEWDTVRANVATCPNNLPRTDQYGVTSYPQLQTLQICYGPSTVERHSRMMPAEDAVRFILDAPAQPWIGPYNYSVRFRAVRYGR